MSTEVNRQFDRFTMVLFTIIMFTSNISRRWSKETTAFTLIISQSLEDLRT